MKISNYVKQVKNTGQCLVLDVGGDIWLGTGYALYRAPSLPRMEGREQVRAVLDVPEKAWKKISLKELEFESAGDVLGMNLYEYCEGERDTEGVRVMVAPNGLWANCRKCKDNGELFFYRPGTLAPIMDTLDESDYIQYTVRTTTTGQRYLVVHDGLDVKAAIMPVQIIDEQYLAALAEFEALCTQQFYRDRERADAAEEVEEEPQAEQIGMEDAADE